MRKATLGFLLGGEALGEELRRRRAEDERKGRNFDGERAAEGAGWRKRELAGRELQG